MSGQKGAKLKTDARHFLHGWARAATPAMLTTSHSMQKSYAPLPYIAYQERLCSRLFVYFHDTTFIAVCVLLSCSYRLDFQEAP